MEIITGYTGENHVTSMDDASLYRGIFGQGDYVLDVGNKFAATIIDNNTVRIMDGDLVIKGHQARIRANDYEEVTIDNGTPGEKRNDLIVARYQKNTTTGIESITLEVVKGTPGETAVDPDVVQEDLSTGGTQRDFVLYRVSLNGLVLENITSLFTVLPNLKDFMTHQAEYATKENITYYVSPTGDDNNNGLTPSTALRNIQTVINKLPKHIFHNVVIQLTGGSWSSEHVNIFGFMGNGTLTIIGDPANNEANNVGSFLINSCLLQIEISSLDLRSTTHEAVMVVNAQSVFVTNCRIVATAPEKDGVRFVYSKGVVTGCNIWNKRYAIYSRRISHVYSDANSGENNSQGLVALDGAVIAKNGTQPDGNVAENTLRGGVIR